MEYILITGFMFLLLLAVMVIAYSQTAGFSNDVTAAQVQKVGNTIVDAANSAYYAGPPTKKTMNLYFPGKINSITFANQSLIFNVQGNGGPYEYVVYAATNMTGTLKTFEGLHTVSVTATQTIVNISG